MEITYKDDKKQKWQSVTASVSFDLPHTIAFSHEAYGADEAEAKTNLLSELSEITKTMVSNVNAIKNHAFGVILTPDALERLLVLLSNYNDKLHHSRLNFTYESVGEGSELKVTGVKIFDTHSRSAFAIRLGENALELEYGTDAYVIDGGRITCVWDTIGVVSATGIFQKVINGRPVMYSNPKYTLPMNAKTLLILMTELEPSVISYTKDLITILDKQQQ